MLERFLVQQPAIYAALLSTEVRKSEQDIFALSEADSTCRGSAQGNQTSEGDASLVMSEESMPILSIIAPLHAKPVTGTEESLDDTQTVKDIKAAVA